MKWIKATDKFPEKEGLYCCRINSGYCGLYLRKKRDGFYAFTDSGGFAVRKITIEWLDENEGWIKVSDRTPFSYITGDFDGKQSDPILSYNAKTQEYKIAHTYEGVMDGRHFIDWYDENDFEIATPTHWQELTTPH